MTPAVLSNPAITRTVDSDGAIRIALAGTIGLALVYATSATLVKELLDGQRSFVLDLTRAGEIDQRLWPKLTDWSWKLQHVDRTTGPAPRFVFDGVSASHRAAIDAEKLSNLYSVRGPA